MNKKQNKTPLSEEELTKLRRSVGVTEIWDAKLKRMIPWP